MKKSKELGIATSFDPWFAQSKNIWPGKPDRATIDADDPDRYVGVMNKDIAEPTS